MLSKGHRTKTTLYLNLSLLVVALIISCLLVACGDAVTPTSSAQPVATATATTAAQTTTAQPTVSTVAQTTTSQSTPTTAAQTTATTGTPGYNPIIRFSTTTLIIGGTLTITGSGYPAATKLNVSLKYPTGTPLGSYGSPVTDSKGNFSIDVRLAGYDHAKALDPGKVLIIVGTQDGKIAASAPLTLVAEVFTPKLTASQLNPQMGQELTLTGSGYPANIDLKLVGGVQNTNEDYGNVTSDAQGKFTKTVKLPEKGIEPGLYFISASSQDFKYQAKVELNVQLKPGTFLPRLMVSTAEVKMGQELTLTGSDYPPNLNVKIVGGVQNPNEEYGSVIVDGQGKFTKTVKLPESGIVPGLYFIYASSLDFKYQAKVQLTVQAK